jgi:hypothetical protein
MIELRLRTRTTAAELESKVGKVLTPDDVNVLLCGPSRVRKPDGSLLCVYLPGAARDAMTEAYPVLAGIRDLTDNRGEASGGVRVRTTRQRRRDVVVPSSRRTRAKLVTSSILGAFDAQGPIGYCRLTAFNAREVEKWHQLVPLWQRLAVVFGEHVPDRYRVQLDHCARTQPDWVVPGTPFTTITVNNTYPTGVHTDKGDLHEGFSVLAVARRGHYTGGVLTFPEYRLGVDLGDGDVVLMDAHEWHGNTRMLCGACSAPIDAPGHDCDATWEAAGDTLPDQPERVSVVAYYRTQMTACGSLDQERAKQAAQLDRRSAAALNIDP